MNKKKGLIFIMYFVFAGFLSSAFAEELAADENTWAGNSGLLKFNGYLQTDNRMKTSDDNNFSWKEYRFDLKAEAKPTDKARFYSDVWLRSLGTSTAKNASDLQDKNKVSPYNLDLREAYADIYGFLFDNLDLRAGRQRIAWGTADRVNPTDNINPFDTEDIWDIGRHLGSDGFKASYYAGKVTMTAVYIPVFTPSNLPPDEWLNAAMPSISVPSGIIIDNETNSIALPENNPSNSTYAAKIGVKDLAGYDFSLSYLRGRDTMPVLNRASLTPITAVPPYHVGVDAELFYPRRQIIGADIAGQIFKIGVWAEGAMFIPEKVTMTTDLSALGLGKNETTILDDDPYYKYVVGGDYTFPLNIYMNIQYIHGYNGFIVERGDNLNDYLMLKAEIKLFEDKLKVTPVCFCVEVDDFNHVKDSYAYVYQPEISLCPVDNAEVTIGAHLIDGKKVTSFGKVKENDEVYLKVLYNF